MVRTQTQVEPQQGAEGQHSRGAQWNAELTKAQCRPSGLDVGVGITGASYKDAVQQCAGGCEQRQ